MEGQKTAANFILKCSGGKRLCCRPHPRNQISNCYSYGYNDGISVDCEQYAKLGCIRDAMELRLISCYFISQLLKSAILTNPLNLSRNANANSPGARFSKNLRKNLGKT